MFKNIRFPVRVVQPKGGPTWSTSINLTTGGNEAVNINWQYPRGRWTCSVPQGKQDVLDEVLAFWHVAKGRGNTWRFKDWTDYSVSRQSIGTTDGSTATFQIVKVYAFLTETASRLITKPVAGTVACWVGGVQRTEGVGATQFQVDSSTGIVTLGATLAATTGNDVEVSCEFDVHARFESDSPDGLTVPRDGMVYWDDIGIVEVPG
jgi:uncharacterized protein (TIGR02217 family)